VSTLTPHHRIHGLAVQTELEELVGGWDAILGFRDRVETVVLGNRDTPCMRSPRILLVSALAALQRGDPEQAAGLEALAEEFEVSGFGHTIDTPRIRLALVRGELGTVERLVAEPLPDRGWHRAWLLLSTQSARLDALAALGRRDEVEAWPAPRPGTYPSRSSSVRWRSCAGTARRWPPPPPPSSGSASAGTPRRPGRCSPS
jgi:hypothetical protein